MSPSSALMSPCSSLFLSPMRPSVRLDFCMSLSRSAMSLPFFFSPRWHLSLCAMSSCSSFLSSAIIWSTDAMTSSKWPLAATFDASAARPRLWCSLASPCRCAAAATARLLPPAETCKKLVVALTNVASASGLERISIALRIPASSSVRRRERSLHSRALVLQADLVSEKKASSASSWAEVSSLSWLASASSLVLSASSKVCLSRVSCSVCISARFVAMSSCQAF
mmetsp:Transcript_76427/g.184960  ORF Transcript_76427/g.184960 Transcript_76427/m.184960 type:complete len:225 (+) Transcript_76427:727-1401(+)